MIRGSAFIGLLLNTITAFAADTSALELLQQMANSLQNLNYRGTVIYSNGHNMESLQVFHQSGPQGERERLVHLSGEPREVLRSNDVVTCYMPEVRSVMVGQQSFGATLINRINGNAEDYKAYYRFKLAGEDRVAGKAVRKIEILPNDKLRYGYRLWLAKDNAMLLKSELLGSNGKVLEQFMFAEIDIVKNIPEALLKPSINGESFTWHKVSAKQQDKHATVHTQWRLARLPKGFTVSESSHRSMPNSEKGADHIVVSDGLASISVYIEDFGVESQGVIGATNFGAVNIFGKLLGEHHQVTVVGDVPASTVKLVADAVQGINND